MRTRSETCYLNGLGSKPPMMPIPPGYQTDAPPLPPMSAPPLNSIPKPKVSIPQMAGKSPPFRYENYGGFQGVINAICVLSLSHKT